jgi:hypothetical protein
MKTTEGYIYCFSNPCMPGILKIGRTRRKPQVRLKEANGSDTWRPPLPYKMEFFKMVSNHITKEKHIHSLLSFNNKRINPNKEFFSVDILEAKLLFDLMDENYISKSNIVDLKTISNISPILEWKKITKLSNYLCVESYNNFILWLQKNMRGLDKSYSYNKYIKIIS